MTRIRIRTTFDRWTPAMVIFCMVAVIACSITVAIEAHANRIQDAQRLRDQQRRTADNTALLKCVNDFSTDLAGSLPVVRKASAHRNAALTNALIGNDKHLGLGRLLVRAQEGVKSDPKKDLADLVKTFEAFERADRHLIAVQKANPYPQPPAKFCDLP